MWGYNLAKNSFTDRDLMALAVALLIQCIPGTVRKRFLKFLPNVLLGSLPSGHTLF